jgi:hypothetical protein
MNTPKIRGLGVVQEGSPTRWNATGAVEGLGGLEAWGTSVVDALTALQTRAAENGTRAGDSGGGLVSHTRAQFLPGLAIVLMKE